MSTATGTIFLRAPQGYSGGSISVEGHQVPIEEVVDDPNLGSCLFVELEPAFAERVAVHGFTPCQPPVGRRQKPACFASDPVIPESWDPVRMDEPTHRIAEQLVVLGFGDARPPTRADFAAAAAALGIELDSNGTPVPNAPSDAAGAGAPVPVGSPSPASVATGAPVPASNSDATDKAPNKSKGK